MAEARDVKIDQAVIGSCTNGRLADMRQAAAVLAGRTVHPDVRCIVIPATQKVYQQCIAEGLMDIFIDAHCAVSTPTCGPCLGGYMGILAAGERAIATTNRNFVGRMGDPTSEVYLSSPARGRRFGRARPPLPSGRFGSRRGRGGVGGSSMKFKGTVHRYRARHRY